MDFSLFPTVLSKKEPNIAQEKSESAEMWKIQLIWGFWWHYKSGGGLYKFGGGSRMAVTSNCVNEKKFFQLEPGEETRNIPILIDTYQCIAWWRLWKQSKKNFTVFWVLYTQLYTIQLGNLTRTQSQLVWSFESQGVSKILRACRNFGKVNG